MFILHKISNTSGKSQLGWLVAASFVMGSGVWAMHFVGMIAFHLELPVHYDVRETSISVFASIIGSFADFYLTMSKQATKLRLALGSFIMGAGIVAMHYIGMSSMRAPAMTIPISRSYGRRRHRLPSLPRMRRFEPRGGLNFVVYRIREGWYDSRIQTNFIHNMAINIDSCFSKSRTARASRLFNSIYDD